MRKYSFSQRMINEWNKLSTDCVNASSVNMFKNKIDNYFTRASYALIVGLSINRRLPVHLPSRTCIFGRQSC